MLLTCSFSTRIKKKMKYYDLDFEKRNLLIYFNNINLEVYPKIEDAGIV